MSLPLHPVDKRTARKSLAQSVEAAEEQKWVQRQKRAAAQASSTSGGGLLTGSCSLGAVAFAAAMAGLGSCKCAWTCSWWLQWLPLCFGTGSCGVFSMAIMGCGGTVGGTWTGCVFSVATMGYEGTLGRTWIGSAELGGGTRIGSAELSTSALRGV